MFRVPRHGTRRAALCLGERERHPHAIACFDAHDPRDTAAVGIERHGTRDGHHPSATHPDRAAWRLRHRRVTAGEVECRVEADLHIDGTLDTLQEADDLVR